jgi:pyruvate,water dikinase
VLTVPFTAAEATEHDLVGGKGANLGRLVAAGFDVPAGYTVTAETYRRFLDETGLADKITSMIADAGTDLDAGTAAVRELITSTPVPGPLADAIVAGYARLGGPDGGARVAVRSSGIAEDLEASSFAGLHDTHLDVRGFDPVVAAVTRCWASLWTARAVAYRRDRGFADAPIAVVVQTMAAAEVAGVLFTAHPMSGATDETVINASWGLGEAIVGGIATPDLFVVKRGVIVERTLGTKAKEVLPHTGAGAGTYTADVPADRRERFCLTDGQVLELAELGRRVQEHYDGFPQDLEWAFDGERFRLLQARPVTGVEISWDADVSASLPGPPEGPDDLWARSWSDDLWTGMVTPLMFSWRAAANARGQSHGSDSWGFPELGCRRNRFFVYHRGKPYYNLALERDMLTRICPPPLRQTSGGYRLPASWQREAAEAPFSWWRWLWMYLRVNIGHRREGVRWYHHLYADYIDDPDRRREFDGPADAELAALSDADLEAWVRGHCVTESTFYFRLFSGLYIHFRDAAGLLGILVHTAYDGPNTGLMTDLLSGQREVTLTAAENRELWRLAELIRASPPLRHLFDSTPGPEFFSAAATAPGGAEFLTEYAGFLGRHGHRGHADRDIWYVRRAEDPWVDYRSLQTLLSGSGAPDPEVRERAVNDRREAAVEEAAANIAGKRLGRLKARLFRALVGYVHKCLAGRDNERHFVDRSTFAIKRALLEAGRRAVRRGRLAALDDCFYLTMDELFALLDPAAGDGAVRLAAAKVAARRRNCLALVEDGRELPRYIRRGAPVELDPPAEAETGPLLRGAGTSRGTVEGVARVVRSLTDIGRVAHGEILVTNSTDPGWTPVFLVLGGIVLETGGMIAHGALLAREYGFPAVQVEGAMGRIPDGARISVDGDAGTVRLLDAEPEQV